MRQGPASLKKGLPITVKVPAFVALLVMLVSVIISQRVLSRLEVTQERQLTTLATTYLDGLVNTLIPAVQREDIWEVFEAVDRAHKLYVAIRPLETVVTAANGSIIASSDPGKMAPLAKPPSEFLDKFADTQLVIDNRNSIAYLRKDIRRQSRLLGAVYSTFDISYLIRERREVLSTLVVTNTLLALLFAALGYWAIRRMVQPIRTLAEHLRSGISDSATKIPAEEFPGSGNELISLYEGYNALVDAENERKELAGTLHEEERMAGLGRLASGMAHEINNPLGGMFNALDTLERYADNASARNTSISLLKRGLSNIRDVVRSTLLTYRTDDDPKPLTRGDLEDLRILVKPELRRRQLQLDWKNDLNGELPVQRSEVRQIALNLLLNACTASPPGTWISFSASHSGQALHIEIIDCGPGMPDDAMRYLTTTDSINAPMRVSAGLGLWMVRRLLNNLSGTITVKNLDPRGARVRVSIRPQPESLQHVA